MPASSLKAGDVELSWPTTSLLCARGRLYAAAGDHDAAVRHLLAAGERCSLWDVTNPALVPWRSSAAVSLARIGELDRVLALADEEIALARRWGAPRAVGVALRAAAIVRGGETAI